MSTCVSQHGEYSEHRLDDEGVCTYCGVPDPDALPTGRDLLASINNAVTIRRQVLASLADDDTLVEAGAVAICHDQTDPCEGCRWDALNVLRAAAARANQEAT